MIQRLIHGTIVFAVALVSTGCSQNKFWSQLPDWEEFPSGIVSRWSPEASFDSAQPSFADAEKNKEQGLRALARLSERRGQSAQAERLYTVMIERDPEGPLPYHRLGVMRAKEGKFSEAEGYFTEALRLAPSDPALLSDVGYCYYLQDRLDEAEQILRRGLEIEPDNPAIANNLGILVGEQGRYDECLAFFQRTGAAESAYANLAFVYAQQGELEKAKAAYSRALTLNQNLRPAAEAMIQLAQHEQLQKQRPIAQSAPRPESHLAAQAIRLPQVTRGPERTQSHLTNVRQVVFSVERAIPEAPATQPSALPVRVRRSDPPTAIGTEISVAEPRWGNFY